MIKIIKRDGRKKDFSKERISVAVNKAYSELYGVENIEFSNLIADNVTNNIMNLNKNSISIEKIQDLVIKELKLNDKKVALAYAEFRNKRKKERNLKHYQELQNKILDYISTLNDNANVDENSFSGREQRLLEYIEKELGLAKLPERIAELHRKHILYQHDLSKFAIGMTNCLFPDVEKLLSNGFKTRQGDVKPVKHYYSLAQVICVIIQLQSLEQFGGCGIMNFDYLAEDYVKYTFGDICKTIVDILEINITIPKKLSLEEGKEILPKHIYDKAIEMLKEELHQADQALITNLVTLQSRSGGQLPFSSINIGSNTSEEGRLITEIFLEELDNGIGRHDRTAIFPITCYQIKKGVNWYETDPNYDLRLKALGVAHRRLYPTFVNCEWSQNKETDLDSRMNLMGCRTLIGLNLYDGTYKKIGRGNLAPVTINLAYLGLKHKQNTNSLFKELNQLLEDAKNSLLIRYDIMKKQPKSVAPFMYENGTMMGAENCIDNVEEALKNNTLSIGYIGLAECVKAVTGYYHNENEESQQLGIKIVKNIRDFCDKCKQELKLNFATYATPAESLCMKTLQTLREEFGIIEGITDKEYITNSHHVPVHCGENVFKKIEIESSYSPLANGGNIFHIETDGRQFNEKAMDVALQYALEKDISYIRFSHQISTCLDCGYNISASMDICERCGSENVENLAIVTGYLTVDVKNMNKGKQDEVRHRKGNI